MPCNMSLASQHVLLAGPLLTNSLQKKKPLSCVISLFRLGEQARARLLPSLIRFWLLALRLLELPSITKTRFCVRMCVLAIPLSSEKPAMLFLRFWALSFRCALGILSLGLCRRLAPVVALLLFERRVKRLIDAYLSTVRLRLMSD